MRLRLPKREHMVETNPEDCMEHHYRPLSAPFYKNRLKMILRLMDEERFERFLDVGSGAGVFFPELASRTSHLFGIDTHHNQLLVAAMCEKEGLDGVRLLQAEALRLPFRENAFDGLLCLSVLVYLDSSQLAGALREMARCVKPGGRIYIGGSVASPARNIAYRLMGYRDYDTAYQSAHRDILEAVGRAFAVERVISMPSCLPLSLSLFFCVRCRNLK